MVQSLDLLLVNSFFLKNSIFSANYLVFNPMVVMCIELE